METQKQLLQHKLESSKQTQENCRTLLNLAKHVVSQSK